MPLSSSHYWQSATAGFYPQASCDRRRHSRNIFLEVARSSRPLGAKPRAVFLNQVNHKQALWSPSSLYCQPWLATAHAHTKSFIVWVQWQRGAGTPWGSTPKSFFFFVSEVTHKTSKTSKINLCKKKKKIVKVEKRKQPMLAIKWNIDKNAAFVLTTHWMIHSRREKLNQCGPHCLLPEWKIESRIEEKCIQGNITRIS